MHFIGIDIGTTSICGIIHDFLNQKTAAITVDNDSWISTEHNWEKIQDPGKTIQAVQRIINQFESQYSDIRGIGITGQMHGILYVNKDGVALSPLYTWQDNRGNLMLNNYFTYAEFLSNYSGFHLSTGYGLVTHFYNLKNSLIPRDTAKLCTIMDYAVMQLTGSKTPLMDYTNAAGIGFFNMQEKKFDLACLLNIGIDPSILPETNPSASFAGHYNSAIPVYSAIGDNQAGFIGSVRDREQSIHVTIGTSSQLSIYSPGYFQLAGIDTRPFHGGGYILVGAALSGGQSLPVLQSLFDSVIRLTTHPTTEVADFYQIINSIEYQKKDSHSLGVTTLFNGSRLKPFARGCISNISANNFTASNLILGLMRGICEEVYQFYSTVPEEIKKHKRFVIGSGNALKKNELLCKVLEDIFNLPVVMSEHDEDAAFGASIAAGVGGKYITDFFTLSPSVK